MYFIVLESFTIRVSKKLYRSFIATIIIFIIQRRRHLALLIVVQHALMSVALLCTHTHTAESKPRLLVKCNASRRWLVNFFRNLSQYRLKKADNVQFMSNEGVHGTIVHLTNLHTWNLHGKVEYISQTSENSFGRLPYRKTGQDSI